MERKKEKYKEKASRDNFKQFNSFLQCWKQQQKKYINFNIKYFQKLTIYNKEKFQKKN